MNENLIKMNENMIKMNENLIKIERISDQNERKSN